MAKRGPLEQFKQCPTILFHIQYCLAVAAAQVRNTTPCSSVFHDQSRRSCHTYVTSFLPSPTTTHREKRRHSCRRRAMVKTRSSGTFLSGCLPLPRLQLLPFHQTRERPRCPYPTLLFPGLHLSAPRNCVLPLQSNACSVWLCGLGGKQKA